MSLTKVECKQDVNTSYLSPEVIDKALYFMRDSRFQKYNSFFKIVNAIYKEWVKSPNHDLPENKEKYWSIMEKSAKERMGKQYNANRFKDHIINYAWRDDAKEEYSCTMRIIIDTLLYDDIKDPVMYSCWRKLYVPHWEETAVSDINVEIEKNIIVYENNMDEFINLCLDKRVSELDKYMQIGIATKGKGVINFKDLNKIYKEWCKRTDKEPEKESKFRNYLKTGKLERHNDGAHSTVNKVKGLYYYVERTKEI